MSIRIEIEVLELEVLPPDEMEAMFIRLQRQARNSDFMIIVDSYVPVIIEAEWRDLPVKEEHERGNGAGHADAGNPVLDSGVLPSIPHAGSAGAADSNGCMRLLYAGVQLYRRLFRKSGDTGA